MISQFKYGPYLISYPEDHYKFLKEVFIFDVYRSDLLKKDDIVLDLGASTGDFSILASKKVGKNGKVVAIEPNKDDYELLKLNIQQNSCENVIPLNFAVGSKLGEIEITFWGKTFKCAENTLPSILSELNIEKVDFVKMDIEGFETEVINNSIDIMKQAEVISIECHNTKEQIDKLLLPYGFFFEPITYGYYYRKVLKNLFSHPIHIYKAGIDSIIKNPKLIYRTFTGYDLTREKVVEGSYIKARRN